MSKIIKEDCKNFSIYNLRSFKALDREYHSGSITWTSGYSGKKDNINYILNKKEGYIELDYKIREHGEGEKMWREINYKIPLTTTPCHYGKKRYWFICPLCSHGKYCGRRVATLYLAYGSDYFACRHCLNLTYNTRNENRRGRLGYLGRFFDLEQQVNKLRNEVKIEYRAGKLTKKCRRLINKTHLLGYFTEVVSNRLLKNSK